LRFVFLVCVFFESQTGYRMIAGSRLEFAVLVSCRDLVSSRLQFAKVGKFRVDFPRFLSIG
jgi:hypothetical protein